MTDTVKPPPQVLRFKVTARVRKRGGVMTPAAGLENASEPAKPEKLRMAATFAWALVQEGAARLGGVAPLTAEVIEARRKVCEGCRQYRRSDQTCALCGCKKMRKTAWRSQRCPVAKW